MAIAGLHNVSVLDSSFLRDTQSQASQRHADEGRPSTQASSILQMWREIEDEHVVNRAEERAREILRQQRSERLNADLLSTNISGNRGSEHRVALENVCESDNDCETWSESQVGSQNEIEDLSNSSCEQSTHFGEVERGRVRQIFREWMNSGGRVSTSNNSQMNSNPRAQWLGENECERVRIVREWVQMNSQQRGACGSSTEEQTAEIGTQIERIRDGLVVNHQEGRTDHTQRRIRRLCGRQALLDMLVKAERERQRELQDLLEHQAVSQFAHRNRIQSLLKGRFLRNERLIENERPNSTAASELGLLRQRNTVTGLREGFLSRLDNSVRGEVCNNHSDTLSNGDINAYRNEEIHANSLQEVPDENFEQSEPSNEGSDIHGLSDHVDDLEGNTVEDRNGQESTAHVAGWHEHVPENVESNMQQIASVEHIERRDSTGENVDGNWQESTANEWSQETSGSEGVECSQLQEAHGAFCERSGPNSGDSNFHGLSDHADDLGGNTVGDIDLQESTVQVEDWHEQVTDSGEGDWQQLAGVEFNDWRDGIGEEMDGNWQDSTVNDWSQELSGNEEAELVHLPEIQEGWHEDNSQEAVGNWLEEPSEPEAVPVPRVDTFYLPEDDNVYSMELRELLSRRSVSNLLRSGFRESLDQLIQSYVERQGHSPVGWELDGTSPSLGSAEHEQEQQSGDQNESQVDAESAPLVLPSPLVPPQPLWDQGLHQDNWSQNNMHQHLGIEWEIINDLRIDMTRLQQRMNNMQRMLEACMDMQLELQRSIRQEVSAALNRSASSAEVCEDSLPKDGSTWDHVRKGICCMCCDSNIDSLLYRCGHMCTCSKCANELVQGRGKCPMCRAPVVEVIRAYSIQ
ncbi:hypothetical protein L1049_014109 [Liquidambar formosana]|uniref:RING-type domain-containing protein n=1 Tax=Liquidambar formosana TaxID=63359 RepID=A0AAP0WZB3_LIQFO